MNKLLLTSILAFGLIGCATTSQQSPEAQESIRYASSPCFGTCPIYSVEISPTGAVHFEGKQYTKVTGAKDLTVNPAAYRKLQQELKSYRPETGKEVKTTDCKETATDQSTAYFSWKRPDGTETKLIHYTGCISPAHTRLNKLIEKLPETLGIEDLIR